MSNLNTLATRAQTVLANDDRTYAGRIAREQALKSLPALAWVLVEYTYTLLSGSDYCWDSQEKGNCTLGEWISGTVFNRHPGNCTHSFRVTAILDATYEGCDQRMEAARVAYEKQQAQQAAKRAAEQAQRDALASQQAALIAKFPVGTKVTFNKKPVAGTVERTIKSLFNDGVVCLVALDAGGKKWLNTNRLTVV